MVVRGVVFMPEFLASIFQAKPKFVPERFKNTYPALALELESASDFVVYHS
jgi:hypothetical protein